MLPTKKEITIDADKCTGCHGCEMACSIKHFLVCGTHYSRIRIQEFREVNTFVPIKCQACEDAACMEVCPMTARVRQENGAVVTDPLKCIGCHVCIQACPFGAVVVNPTDSKTMSCDLCDDDPMGPWCVKACTMQKALRFVDAKDAARGRAREWASKLKVEFQPPGSAQEETEFEFSFCTDGGKEQ